MAGFEVTFYGRFWGDHRGYRAHLETPHFKKYKTGTQDMVKSLKLIETDPIMLGTKPR